MKLMILKNGKKKKKFQRLHLRVRAEGKSEESVHFERVRVSAVAERDGAAAREEEVEEFVP